MKKINKLIIFNLMFISFFIGINFVNAVSGNGASINGSAGGGYSSGSGGSGTGDYIILKASPVTGFRMTLVDAEGTVIGESKDFVANRENKIVVQGVLYYSNKKYNRALIVSGKKPQFHRYLGCGYTSSNCDESLNPNYGYYGTFSKNRNTYYEDFFKNKKGIFDTISSFNNNSPINKTIKIKNQEVLEGNYKSVVDYFNKLNSKGYNKINDFVKQWWGNKNDLSELACETDGELFVLVEPMITVTKGAEYWFGTVTEIAKLMQQINPKNDIGYYEMSRYLYASKVEFKSNGLSTKFKGLKKVTSSNKPKSADTFLKNKAYGTGIVWIKAANKEACNNTKPPTSKKTTCSDYKEDIGTLGPGEGKVYPRYKYKSKAANTSVIKKVNNKKVNEAKKCLKNPSKDNEYCTSLRTDCMKAATCADYTSLGNFSYNGKNYMYNKQNANIKVTKVGDENLKGSLIRLGCYKEGTEYDCNSSFSGVSSSSTYRIKAGTFNYDAYSSINQNDEDLQDDYLEACKCNCNSGGKAIETGCTINTGKWDEETFKVLKTDNSDTMDYYNMQCPPCESFDNPPTDGETPGTNTCTATADSTTPKTCEDYARFDNKVDLSGNMLQIKACLSTLSNGTGKSLKNFSEIYGVPTICKEDYSINYNAATFSTGINTSFGIATYLNFNNDNNRVSAEATRTCWLDEGDTADFVENETVPTSIYWDTDYFHTTTAVNELHDGASLGFSQSGGDKTRTGTITVNYSNGSSQQFKVSPTYISSTNTIIYGDVDFDSTSLFDPNQNEPNMSPYSAPTNATNEDNSDIKISYKMANDKSVIYYKIEKNNNNITSWYWSTNNKNNGVNYTFYPLGSPDGNAYPTLNMSTDENALKRVGRIYLKYNDGSLKEYVVKPDPISGENHFYKEIEIKPNSAANTISKSTNADGSTNLGITAFYSYAVYQDNEVNNFLSEKDNKSDYYPKAPDLGFDYYEKVRNQSFRVDSTNYLNPTVNLNENSITTTVRYNYIPTTSFAIDLVKAEFQYDPNQSSDTFKDPTRKVEKSEYSYITPVKSTEFSKTSTNTTGSAFESKSNASDKGNVRKIGPSDTDGHVFPIRFSTGYNKNGYEYLMWVESYNMNEKALNYKASYNQANNNECSNQYACNYLVSDNDCKKNTSVCSLVCNNENDCEEVCYCPDDPTDPNSPGEDPKGGVNFVYTSISTDTVLDKKTTTAIGENWLTEKGEKTIKEIEETSHKGETFDDDNAIYTIKLDTELVNYIKNQTGKQYVTSPNCTGTYKVDGKDIPDLYYCESSFLDDLKLKYSTKIANNIKYYAYYDSSTGTYSAWK